MDAENAKYFVEEVCDFERFKALSVQWRELGKCPDADFAYFQTFDWCAAWWDTVGATRPDFSPHILCLWQGEQLCAVWPLMRDRAICA